MGHNERRTLANLPQGERVLVDSNIRIFASTSRGIIYEKKIQCFG